MWLHRRPLRLSIGETSGSQPILEPTHNFIQLRRRAVDIQDRVLRIGREEQGEPVLADLDRGVPENANANNTMIQVVATALDVIAIE